MSPALLDADGKERLCVAIVIPCQDQVAARFAMDLTKLVGYMVAVRPDIRILVYINKGTIIPEQRHLLVRMALQENPTHFLWLDSDMGFPKDALLRLLSHGEPIVGCNYATRRQPVIPTASVGSEDDLLFSDPDATELVEVARAGMGCMLVDADIYRQIPAPWFALGFNREADGYAGEDIFFCDLMQRRGQKVWVDPVLSRKLVHCGEFEYGLIHADITKEKYLEQQRAKEG